MTRLIGEGIDLSIICEDRGPLKPLGLPDFGGDLLGPLLWKIAGVLSIVAVAVALAANVVAKGTTDAGHLVVLSGAGLKLIERGKVGIFPFSDFRSEIID